MSSELDFLIECRGEYRGTVPIISLILLTEVFDIT